MFILIDFAIINYDHDNNYDDSKIRKADKFFVVSQSILDLVIVLCYVILFVLFLKLINNKEELIFMKRNILTFFIFMLVVLPV